MASSFEKSVKGATKIKVRSSVSAPCSAQDDLPRTRLTSSRSAGSSPQDKVHRAHPHSYTCRRGRGRRGLPGATAQAERLDMDRRLQEFDYRAPDDQGGVARRYTGIFGKTQEHASREHVLRWSVHVIKNTITRLRPTYSRMLTPGDQLKPKVATYDITPISSRNEPKPSATPRSTGYGIRTTVSRSCRLTRDF